jgi:AcrR family transcriptional regulator
MATSAPFSLRDERDVARAKLRAAVLSSAAEMLAAGGAHALSARTLAQAVGASTKIIYSHFGGMPQVIACVYAHGFQELTLALQTSDDATLKCDERLWRVARCYRAFAQTNANLFALMYGPHAKTLVPLEADRNAAISSLNVIENIISNKHVRASTKRSDARELAYIFWVTVHGPVSLEATGWLHRNSDDVFESIVNEAIRNVMR